MFLSIVRGAEYGVNVYADHGDLNPGDGICQSDGFYNCSLRAAIEEANLDGEDSTITFAIPLFGTESIWAASIPALTEPTIIDASARWQGSWPEGRPGVELRATDNSLGMLYISANNCMIYGLIFSGSGNRSIYIASASDTIIGGIGYGQRNIIAGGGPGISIDPLCQNTTISGNYFGTYDGLTPTIPATGQTGILALGSGSLIADNVIAGYAYGITMTGYAGQIIGNRIGINIQQSGVLPNVIGIQMGGGAGLVETNFICGNENHGILCFHDTSTIIRNNVIGNGIQGQHNAGDGIHIEQGHDLQILDNIIAGNLGHGISASPAFDCIISRNHILANHRSGIELAGTGNSIGVADSEPSNAIYSNLENGIHLQSIAGFVDTTSNFIVNNTIGMSPYQLADYGNSGNGILIDNAAHHNSIGGSSLNERNWIGWNKMDGIALNGANVSGNIIQGNVIGALFNFVITAPNGHHGISLYSGAAGNTIGSVQGNGNLIIGNGWSGIAIVGADYNAILSNEIGGGAEYSTGNAFYGIHVNGSTGTQILLNNISLNGTNSGESGILVQGATATGNTISLNSIHDHAGPGIELFDQGNGNLAAPVITSVSVTHVEGTSIPGGLIEIFSDYGDEGRHYEITVGCDTNGVFGVDHACQGPFLTATVTDGSMNTSPFSAPVPLSSLGMSLEMPAQYFSYGDSCFLRAHIRNDQPRTGVPVAVVLDVLGSYWFWPGWTHAYDESVRDIPTGNSEAEIISQFVWPDTGYDTASNITFWGAMLTAGRDEVLGGNAGIGKWTFGFGP